MPAVDATSAAVFGAALMAVVVAARWHGARDATGTDGGLRRDGDAPGGRPAGDKRGAPHDARGAHETRGGGVSFRTPDRRGAASRHGERATSGMRWRASSNASELRTAAPNRRLAPPAPPVTSLSSGGGGGGGSDGASPTKGRDFATC